MQKTVDISVLVYYNKSTIEKRLKKENYFLGEEI